MASKKDWATKFLVNLGHKVRLFLRKHYIYSNYMDISQHQDGPIKNEMMPHECMHPFIEMSAQIVIKGKKYSIYY